MRIRSSVVRAKPGSTTLFTRRQFLKALAATSAGSTAFGSYALAEPFRLNVTRYGIQPRNWPRGMKLRLAILADLHACEPWMPQDRIRRIVARANALQPDATLLLGDYIVSNRLARVGRSLDYPAWTGALSALRAPLGVHAVLGNHDWWDDRQAQTLRKGPCRAHSELQRAGIAVYDNDVIRLAKDGQAFWLAGLGDQWAFWPQRRRTKTGIKSAEKLGVDDLPGTLAKVTDDAPVILMAHEPEIFPTVSDRVALTLSGHTHGGQVRLFGYSPIVPSRYGQRFAYGHVVEEGRHLVVSGGLGVSGIPVRFGMPPEIVVVELS